MHHGNQARRRSRRQRGTLTLGVIGLVVSVLMLAACNSGDSAAGKAGPTTTAGPPVSISISPAGSSPTDPTDPITVKATNGTLTKVTVTNAKTGTVVTGQQSSDGTTWTSNEVLGYGATYNVVADGSNGHGGTTEQKGSVTTVTPASTVYPNLVPAPSVTDVGVGQVIEVQFDKAITDKAAAQKAMTVTSNPPQTGGWYWVSSKEVHYRPEVYWKPGTTVTLHIGIYGVNLGNGVYGQTDRDVTYHIHDSWIAKADGNTEQMQIFHNGTLVNTMPISMGKDSTPTHTGPHVISAKNQTVEMNSCTYGVCPPNPNAYDVTEYWAERISNDGEFVHENPDSVSDQGSSNVSHGCINLNQANAEWFFNHFGPGDVVEVSNSGGPPLPIWDTYGDWELSWAQWQSGSAV